MSIHCSTVVSRCKSRRRCNRGGRNVVTAYLRALFQADGCVRIREERKSADVVFGTISPKLADGVSHLLSNLGIFNRVQVGHDSRADRQDYYHVVVAWKDGRRLFADSIGFISSDKKAKLANALAMPGRNVAAVRDEVITAIEYVADEDVYDIETESHSFLTNNVVVHNCFIQSVSDDLVNEGGIMDLWVREARIFKFGSGTGSNFSNLRGEGEKLSGGGTSSGLMSFLRVGDRAAGAIKSGGTTRRAAKMVVLDLDHPDVEQFIDWKVIEEQKVSDLVTGLDRVREASQRDHESGQQRSGAGSGTARSRAQSATEDRDARSAIDGHPPSATFNTRLTSRARATKSCWSRPTIRIGIRRRTARYRGRTRTTPCASRTSSSPVSTPARTGIRRAAPTVASRSRSRLRTCGKRSPLRRGSAPIRACSSTRRSTNGTPARPMAGSTPVTRARNTCSSTIRHAISRRSTS